MDIYRKCQWCPRFARSSLLLVLAAVNVVAIWVLFVAEPLKISGGEIVGEMVPGREFKIRWTGKKTRWADRACVARSATTIVTDVTGELFMFEAPFGYNDGSIKRPVESYILPRETDPGEGRAWHRVVYECFSFQTVTVQSPKIPVVIARN